MKTGDIHFSKVSLVFLYRITAACVSNNRMWRYDLLTQVKVSFSTFTISLISRAFTASKIYWTYNKLMLELNPLMTVREMIIYIYIYIFYIYNLKLLLILTYFITILAKCKAHLWLTSQWKWPRISLWSS